MPDEVADVPASICFRPEWSAARSSAGLPQKARIGPVHYIERARLLVVE